MADLRTPRLWLHDHRATMTGTRNYPPQTKHRRPTTRKFWIWQDMTMSYAGYKSYRWGRWELHPWRWCCTFCDPPAFGMLVKRGAFERIINQSMPRHFQHREMHHRHVAREHPSCR